MFWSASQKQRLSVFKGGNSLRIHSQLFGFTQTEAQSMEQFFKTVKQSTWYSSMDGKILWSFYRAVCDFDQTNLLITVWMWTRDEVRVLVNVSIPRQLRQNFDRHSLCGMKHFVVTKTQTFWMTIWVKKSKKKNNKMKMLVMRNFFSLDRKVPDVPKFGPEPEPFLRSVKRHSMRVKRAFSTVRKDAAKRKSGKNVWKEQRKLYFRS